jgi:ketosteroid isomerase-like protein
MSQAEIDLVRRFYACFTAADRKGLLETIHPEIEFVPVFGLLYRQKVYEGIEGMAAWYDEVDERFDTFEAYVTDEQEMPDKLIVWVRLVGHRDGDSLTAEMAVDCRFRDDKIVQFVGRALEDVAAELGRDS